LLNSTVGVLFADITSGEKSTTDNKA